MAGFLFHGAVTPTSVGNLETLMLHAFAQGAPNMTLYLCSGGGDVTAGVGLYNFIRMIPVPVHIHAFGNCSSVAATVLLAGERRTSATVAQFNLHAATYKDGANQGQVAHSNAILIQPFAETLGWTAENLAHYFGTASETSLDPSQAAALGIIHAIEDLKFPLGESVSRVSMG